MKQRRKKERTWAEAARLVRARTARGAPAGRGGAEGPVPGRVCVCVLGGGVLGAGPGPFSPRGAGTAELRAGPHHPNREGMRPRARPRVVLGNARGMVNCPRRELGDGKGRT